MVKGLSVWDVREVKKYKDRWGNEWSTLKEAEDHTQRMRKTIDEEREFQKKKREKRALLPALQKELDALEGVYEKGRKAFVHDNPKIGEIRDLISEGERIIKKHEMVLKMQRESLRNYLVEFDKEYRKNNIKDGRRITQLRKKITQIKNL